MLNKKQIFGLVLMIALLSPICVNAMGGADGGAAGAGIMAAIDNKILYYINWPLQTVMTKVVAMGPKNKLVATLLAAYIGYSASGQVAQDVTTNIPNAVKSLVGIDCEDSSCRGDNWTEAA